MTPDDLVAAAHHAVDVGTYFGPGQCLKSCRTLAGAPGGVYDAVTAWRNAQHRYPGFGQPGTFEFWQGGSAGHGHVAISLGEIAHQPWCISLDVRRPGRMDPIPTALIHDSWGLTHLGHTTDINGVNITGGWDEMATKAEIRQVMQSALADALTADNPALVNAIRVAIEAERAEDAAAVKDALLSADLRNQVRIAVQAELRDERQGENPGQ